MKKNSHSAWMVTRTHRSVFLPRSRRLSTSNEAQNSFASTVGSFTYMLRSELIHSEGNNDSQRWRIALTQSAADVFHQLWLLAVRAAKWGREWRGRGRGRGREGRGRVQLFQQSHGLHHDLLLTVSRRCAATPDKQTSPFCAPPPH